MGFAECFEYELQIQEGGDVFDHIETDKDVAKRQRHHRKDGKGRKSPMTVLYTNYF